MCKMKVFISVIIKDPQIRIKKNFVLDKYSRLPDKYQSKIGYDNLIQNVIVKELINIMSTIKIEIDKEKK